MRKTLAAVMIVALFGAAAGTSFAAAGSCGKGKMWDADRQKCVAKPRGSGSHAE